MECFIWHILWMEEILHQLIGGLSHYVQGFNHPRWCRISSIHRMKNMGKSSINKGLQLGNSSLTGGLTIPMFHYQRVCACLCKQFGQNNHIIIFQPPCINYSQPLEVRSFFDAHLPVNQHGKFVKIDHPSRFIFPTKTRHDMSCPQLFVILHKQKKSRHRTARTSGVIELSTGIL